MRSLAVLPFVNTSREADAEYLSDGITESIINSLSQLPKLRVVPRSTVFAYKGVAVNPRSVGLALNVDSLVTGRVTQQGSLLNVQAELVDVATETQVWGDQYRHPVSDLISLQEQIAWQISEALRIRLSAPQKKRFRKRATGSGEAYQAYLRGRHEWSKWRAEGFRSAIGHFETAISIDPKYALAYAGLPETYGALGYYGPVSRRHTSRLASAGCSTRGTGSAPSTRSGKGWSSSHGTRPSTCTSACCRPRWGGTRTRSRPCGAAASSIRYPC